jgi:hypothetical protein
MHLNLQLTALVIPNDATLLPTSASLVGKEQARSRQPASSSVRSFQLPLQAPAPGFINSLSPGFIKNANTSARDPAVMVRIYALLILSTIACSTFSLVAASSPLMNALPAPLIAAWISDIGTFGRILAMEVVEWLRKTEFAMARETVAPNIWPAVMKPMTEGMYLGSTLAWATANEDWMKAPQPMPMRTV